jgi:IclR family acetate operon transcriptional repressor
MDRTINVPSGGAKRTIAMLELLALGEEPLKLSDIAH